MISAIWKSALKAARTTQYQIEALAGGKLSVLFLNHINDQVVSLFQVLFPGEKSNRLEIPAPK